MQKFKVVHIAALVAALFVDQACARSIYVDATTSQTVQDGQPNTPYKTIAQVSKAQNVKAGDSVYFRCDRSWPGDAETPTTLRLISGVTYSSYYRQADNATVILNGCTKSAGAATLKPILRGSVKLSNLAWAADTNNPRLWSAIVPASVRGFANIAQLIDSDASGGSRRMQRARHPNVGKGNYAGESNYLHVGSSTPVNSSSEGPFTMQLDPSAAVAPNLAGAQAFVRNTNWLLSRFNVDAHNGNLLKLSYDDPLHQLRASIYPNEYDGLGGYWLENKLWMLDSPGEWFYDTTSGRLYIWLAENTKPAATYYAAVNSYGITSGISDFSPTPPTKQELVDAANIANDFSISNIDVRDTALDGLALMGTAGKLSTTALNKFTLLNVGVTRAGRFGIAVRDANGGNGVSANRIVIQNVTVDDSLDIGIDLSGFNEPAPTSVASSGAAWMDASQGINVLNNTLTNIGVGRFALSALRIGGYTNVQGNTITNVISRAIDVQGPYSKLTNNSISKACTGMEDCGAIYTNSTYNTSVADLQLNVTGNVVNTVGNSIDGARPTNLTGNSGIYLDDYAMNVTLDGNSVIGADLGIYLHGARNAVVKNNMVDLSRKAALLMGPSADWSLWTSANNEISRNAFLSRDGLNTPVVDLSLGSAAPGSASFARFSGNAYGARTGTAFWDSSNNPQYIAKQTYAEWKAIWGDAGGRAYLDVPYYQPSTTPAANLITKGAQTSDAETFTTNVGAWASDQPASQVAAYLSNNAVCFGNGSCLRLTNSNDWIPFHTTTSFAVSGGQTYLVVFDAQSNNGAANSLMVRLMTPDGTVELAAWVKASIGTKWKRYVVALPVGAQFGPSTAARLDIITHANSSFLLDNVRLIPVTLKTNPEPKTFYVLANETSSAASYTCPTNSSTSCSNFDNMMTGARFYSKVSLAAKEHTALIWRNNAWLDQDGDNVPDGLNMDKCLGTLGSMGTSEVGCGLGQ